MFTFKHISGYFIWTSISILLFALFLYLISYFTIEASKAGIVLIKANYDPSPRDLQWSISFWNELIFWFGLLSSMGVSIVIDEVFIDRINKKSKRDIADFLGFGALLLVSIGAPIFIFSQILKYNPTQEIIFIVGGFGLSIYFCIFFLYQIGASIVMYKDSLKKTESVPC